MICGGANDTSGCHLAVFSEDVAVARHFVAIPALPCTLHAGMLVVLTTPVKKLCKKAGYIQLAIHSTVGAWVEYK